MPEEKVLGAEKEVPEDSPIPSPTHSPPQWGPEASEDQEAELHCLEFDLGPPPELGLDVEHLFQEQEGEDGGSHPSQEPLVEDYERWVEWRGQIIATLT